MQDTYNNLFLPELRQMLLDDDADAMREFCTVLFPAILADLLNEFPVESVWRVLATCELERRAEIFEFFDLPKQVELAAVLERDPLSHLIESMAHDDRVDLLSRMPPERVDDLLPLMAAAERNDIRRLLSYPDDSAGSIMTTDYATLQPDVSVRDALEQLRAQAPDSETIYYIYVIGENRSLLGFVSLRQLILARPDRNVSEFMRRDVISMRVDDDQEDVALTLAKYDFIAIPVVDETQRLVGIVTHDDVLDVVQEEATEDAYRQGAVEPLVDSYLETPLPVIAWKRGVWLLFLALVALVTAKALQHYEQVSTDFATGDGPSPFGFILLFLPLVLASGGNAGSQSATLIIRTIALGETDHRDNYRLAVRELLLGLVLGLSIALVGFLAAEFWFQLGHQRSLIVASTVLLVVILGTVAGAMLPLLFRGMGMDPALMSNPLIAALVDVLGVVIYYEVAFLVLGN